MITQERVKELFTYDNGRLIWKKKTSNLSRVCLGSVAGGMNKRGYMRVTIDSKSYYIHRLVFLYHHGNLPKYIDHINGIKSDNNIENIRACTSSQNSFNAKLCKTNVTGVKGVYFHKSKKMYVSRVKSNGSVWEKSYKTLEEAVKMVKQKREELHGEFACHGGDLSL